VKTRAVAIAVGALVVLGGCGSGSSGGSSPGASGSTAPATPQSGAPTPTSSVTPSPTPTTTVTSTAPASLSRCLSSQLSLSLGQGQGAAGTTYTPIVFTNTGTTACELRGYPGVSFVDAAGHLIGAPAGEDPGKVKTVKLAASGGGASALLRQPNPGNFPPSACQQTTAAKLRVYPPGETVALFLADPAPVCSTKAGRTGVRPLAAGDGS
jgi:hypothetical protein